VSCFSFEEFRLGKSGEIVARRKISAVCQKQEIYRFRSVDQPRVAQLLALPWSGNVPANLRLLVTATTIAVAVCGEFGIFQSISTAQELRKITRDYNRSAPKTYAPDDPWTSSLLYRYQAGFAGKYFNCDGEEEKRYSPYICWKTATQTDTWKNRTCALLSWELREVRQRIEEGSCGTGRCRAGTCPIPSSFSCVPQVSSLNEARSDPGSCGCGEIAAEWLDPPPASGGKIVASLVPHLFDAGEEEWVETPPPVPMNQEPLIGADTVSPLYDVEYEPPVFAAPLNRDFAFSLSASRALVKSTSSPPIVPAKSDQPDQVSHVETAVEPQERPFGLDAPDKEIDRPTEGLLRGAATRGKSDRNNTRSLYR
jgi:hypothetical protein